VFRYTAVFMPFLVHTMAWSSDHRAFVIDELIENGGSPIMTQRAFRIRFALSRLDTVPDKRTIHNWVSNFGQTGSALKGKSTGRHRIATGRETVAPVRASIEQSPRRSARKHADALWLSDRSARRFLHRELSMHPYKIVIAQELSERGCETRTTFCQELPQIVPRTTVLLFKDEAHFHLSGTVNKHNFRY
jgi:hypothetical protein